jgi:hypothetical protein
MSPIQEPPNRGYADWQRVSNYDTDLIWNITPVSGHAPIVSPIIDVSRFLALGGAIGEQQSSSLWTFQWYADDAGAIPVGARRFTTTINISSGATVRIPNLGPWVQITIAPLTGASFLPYVRLTATNRDLPIDFVPIDSQLIVRANQVIGAAASQDCWPETHFAGPIRIWGLPLAAGIVYSVQSLNTVAAFDIVDEIRPAANVDFSITTVAPTSAWKVLVTNAGAATNYYLSVTPSLTGSS